MNDYNLSDKYTENSCACEKCQQMCKKTPCMGTPEEILRIAKAGFGDKLFPTTWLVGFYQGILDKPVDMVAPKMTNKGCAFQDEQGLCILHSLGLKPLEGRMTDNHGITIINTIEEALRTPVYVAATEWAKRDFDVMKRKIFRNTKA
ncbi:hypothetical protein [uncultured Chryseobacterium sp.]|uniref:hypothetical protein n=1 Tax=uncultured Chryseobacterium sp. TaxID=259322 RepID=UPI0025EDE0A1|nr:hypothetical protein [uncultured Chryseobacterium sp.]